MLYRAVALLICRLAFRAKNKALRAIKYKDKSHEPDDLMKWIDAKLKSVKAQEANLDSELAALMH